MAKDINLTLGTSKLVLRSGSSEWEPVEQPAQTGEMERLREQIAQMETKRKEGETRRHPKGLPALMD
eukprot:scaffold439_cov415-Prasinococcus_capsulatus_cf.AAC.11